MKKILNLLFVLAAIQVYAEDNKPQPNGGNKEMALGEYKYQIAVVNQTDASVVLRNNSQIDQIQGNTRSLGTAIAQAYKSSITQKTVNATSNIIDLGVSYVTELVKKRSNDFDEWSKAKQQQCTFKKDLSSDETIDDFYYSPSVNGALDPRDLKFNGFVCRNFIEQKIIGKNDSPKKENRELKPIGKDVFYVSCRLRTDSLGIAHLTNHSKFLLEIDSLAFNPKYCNIPNQKSKEINDRFNFQAYSNLVLEMKVKVFSSWINEAIMITSDCQLGEFVIRAKIDEKGMRLVGRDSLFIYSKHELTNDSFVSIYGESFIVPRSFVGTNMEPVWGTGQYRLAIEVSQSCQLNADYYGIKIDEIGNGKAVNFANLPGYKKWEKDIWREEWRKMKHRRKGDSFMTNVWKEIKTAYIGSNWVKELLDPTVTQLLQYETDELNGLFNLDSNVSTTQPQQGNGVVNMPANGASGNQMPMNMNSTPNIPAK